MKNLRSAPYLKQGLQNGAAANLALNHAHCEHSVQFYDSDAFLAESVSSFIGDGIRAGEGTIVIGTPEHREAIERRLSERGIDVLHAKTNGQYVSLDAVETLSQFMVADLPDRNRFEALACEMIDKMSNGRQGVRGFGEMVSLLWAQGNKEAAILLEELWNEVTHTHPITILCGYPMKNLLGVANIGPFDRLCRAHSQVFPTENYTAPGHSGRDRLRAIASLEQRSRSLEVEIEDRKRIELALGESEARLHAIIEDNSHAGESLRHLAAIVECSDDAIISKDLNGVIMSWNRGAERIFGYTASEIIGRNITTLIPLERQSEEPHILARLRCGERIDHYETIRTRKDGSEVNVSITVSPIKDATGKIVGASKIARDITEKKRSELNQKALFDLNCTVNHAVALPQIYDAALTAICRCQNANRAAILLHDTEGLMRFKAWRGLSDEYRRAVEGHSPWRQDDPDPQPVCIENVAGAGLSDRMQETIAREGIHALAFLPITYEGCLLGKFMISYDKPHRFAPEELQPTQTIINHVAFAIERRKTAENLERTVNERTASLREAIVQMEEFSYSVSHDLRAPVRAMQCYAEVIKEDYGAQLDDTAKKYLDRIIHGGTRMDRLIQDILTYSRMSRGEIQLQPVALEKLMRDLVRQHLDMGASRAEISVEGRLLSVIGHEPSLAQAISNLLNNALKFVAPGTAPKVRIRSEQLNGDVRLWIEDNGIGIKPEYQHRLFSVFERIHPEKNYEGTGIGLAIVRKAAERMSGKVGVESDGVAGCRFWIQLPAAPNL